MDELMKYHSIDIQWGNHDVIWMGAAAGSEACIFNVIRICSRYNNLDILEDGYGINIRALTEFAKEEYNSMKLYRTSIKRQEARLPLGYKVYVFDLYGTLVDIHTDENDMGVWEKLSLFYGYYKAHYKPQELKEAYERLVKDNERSLKSTLENDPKYAHEASPEIEMIE